MESINDSQNAGSLQGLKQVKVDNWGTFLLQRLLQLYFNEDLLDLKIRFRTTDNVLNVHRLVISTVTDYFLQLEYKQNDGLFSTDGIVMPLDMPYECVKSIISFIYTGHLEYRNSDENVLYHAAQKMNITVLIKLLDTQVEKHISQTITLQNISAELTTMEEKYLSKIKETGTSTLGISSDDRLLLTDEGKDSQLPINITNNRCTIQHHEKYPSDITEGPSRFDIPEVEDMTLGVFSSFDDITYNTKPIMQASEDLNGSEVMKEMLTDTLTNKFINIDYQNHLRDQGKRSSSPDTNSWLESESTVELEDLKPSSVKKFRCNHNEKENHENTENILNIKPIASVSNHANIIREVLKKYPHLVQHNKNIRLKIMQKESKNSESSLAGKTKISYVVLTSDSLKADCNNDEVIPENSQKFILDNSGNGPWKCTKCNLEEMYTNYSVYRRHMQGVHDFKFDPRVCEYCGYKATKRNILIYHMYTKHNVPLPRNMSFPKCHLCSYVALSELLLSKHQANHKHCLSSLKVQNSHTDSFQCAQYKKNFVDAADLVCHDATNNDDQLVNDREKNNFNSLPVENLNTNVNYDEKSPKKYNRFFDMSSSSCLSINNTDLDVPNEKTLVITNFDSPNLWKTNNQEIKTLLTETTSAKNLEVESLRVKATENFSNSKTSEKGDCMNNLKNNKVLVQDTGKNLIVSARKSKNSNPFEEINQDTSNKSKVFEHGRNTKIIERDKLLTINTLINKKEEIIIEEKRSGNRVNNSPNLSPSTDILNKKELIHYIEEETEILEYESCNSVEM